MYPWRLGIKGVFEYGEKGEGKGNRGVATLLYSLSFSILIQLGCFRRLAGSGAHCGDGFQGTQLFHLPQRQVAPGRDEKRRSRHAITTRR